RLRRPPISTLSPYTTLFRSPQDKALVENQVRILYSRVYARLRNMQFFDLASLNQAIRMKVKAHNQTRMQKKPYCREEKFLADERSEEHTSELQSRDNLVCAL